MKKVQKGRRVQLTGTERPAPIEKGHRLFSCILFTSLRRELQQSTQITNIPCERSDSKIRPTKPAEPDVLNNAPRKIFRLCPNDHRKRARQQRISHPAKVPDRGLTSEVRRQKCKPPYTKDFMFVKKDFPDRHIPEKSVNFLTTYVGTSMTPVYFLRLYFLCKIG